MEQSLVTLVTPDKAGRHQWVSQLTHRCMSRPSKSQPKEANTPELQR